MVITEERKIVVFRIGKQEYGVSVDKLISIEKMRKFSKLSKTQENIRGVIKLENQLIPIFDLRKLLLYNMKDNEKKNKILIVNIMNEKVGLVVDQATGVVDISDKHIQSISINQKEIHITNISEKLTILLEIEDLLFDQKLVDSISQVINDLS